MGNSAIAGWIARFGLHTKNNNQLPGRIEWSDIFSKMTTE